MLISGYAFSESAATLTDQTRGGGPYTITLYLEDSLY